MFGVCVHYMGISLNEVALCEWGYVGVVRRLPAAPFQDTVGIP